MRAQRIRPVSYHSVHFLGLSSSSARLPTISYSRGWVLYLHSFRFMSSSPTSSTFRSKDTKWHHRHERRDHSLFRCKKYDADPLPAVGLPGGLCSTTFLITCSLTNLARYRMDRQIVLCRSLRWRASAMAWCLQGRHFVRCHHQHPISILMGWQPNLRRSGS